MNPKSVLLTLFLFGCSPIVVEGESLYDETAAGDDVVAGDKGGAAPWDSGTGDLSDEPEPEPELTMQSGDWVATDADMVDDPCDFNGFLQNNWGISIASLLPSDFEVEGEEGTFEIEAQSYGARAPIECVIDGDEFTCETQTVYPLYYDLGDYGWVYEIDFSGTAVDDSTLEGRAVVAYTDVDQYTAGAFDYYGVDAASCSQTFSLTLELDR